MVPPVRCPSRDHVRARVRGGTLAPDNRMIVCDPCNGAKGAKSLARFLHHLIRASDPRAGHVAAVMRSRGDLHRCEICAPIMDSGMDRTRETQKTA